MKIKFNTTRSKGEKSPLRVAITDKSLPGGRLYVATGISIPLKYWDPKSQRLKESKKADASDNPSVNSRLAEIEKIAKDFINDEDNVISKLTIANLINPDKPMANKVSMIQWMRDDLASRAKLASATVKSIKESIDVLEDFIEKKAPDLNFHNFSYSVYEKFIKFMISERNGVEVDGKTVYHGMKPSSRGKIIKNVKMLLKRAHLDSDYKVNLDYPRFKVERESMDDPRVALNKEERATLIEAEIKLERLDKVRDLFVLQMFTGLRVGDLMSLKKEDFNFERSIITKRTGKTGKAVSIPLFPPVKAIYEKYKGEFPKISEPKYNEYQKELFLLLKLDRPIMVTEMNNGKEVSKRVPLHDVISSHDARRTFITAALNEWNIPAIKVIGFTGQKLKTVERYNKPDKEDVAAEYAKMSVS